MRGEKRFANRTTAPAPTIEELEVDVSGEESDETEVEVQPKKNETSIEGVGVGYKIVEQEFHGIHSKGTSTAMPSTTQDLFKSESQIKREYE